MDKEQFLNLVKNSKSINDLSFKVFGYSNTGRYKILREYIKTFEANTSHFVTSGSCSKIPKIIKICPICKKEFITQTFKGKKEKTTCSHSCSNTYFRSSIHNGNWKEGKEKKVTKTNSYQTTCFFYHGKKCIICGETISVAAHHYDGNPKNSVPENLVPLCMNHHVYYHSRYRYLVEPQINQFIENFKKRGMAK